MFEKLTGTMHSGFRALAEVLPGLMLAALQLNLVLLFFWYAWQFSEELSWPWDMAQALIFIPALLILIFGAWAFVAGIRVEWRRAESAPAEVGRLWPFALLSAAPVLAVGIVRYWHSPAYQFNRPLLVRTRELIENVVGWISHLL